MARFLFGVCCGSLIALSNVFAATATSAPSANVRAPIRVRSSAAITTAIAAQSTCDNFIRADDHNVYFGFGPYKKDFGPDRPQIPSKVEMRSLANPAQMLSIATDDSSIDLISFEGKLYVLTYTGVEIWDAKTLTREGVYPTYNLEREMQYKEHATAMIQYGRKLVISHGRLGYAVFDIDTRKIVAQSVLVQKQAPLESMATGITLNGDRALILMDNFDLPTPNHPYIFHGIVVLNLTTLQVEKELTGLDAGADAITSDQNYFIVSDLGLPVLKYSLANLADKVIGQPIRAVFHFPPLLGHPTGSPLLTDDMYYTCFYRKPNTDEGSLYKLITASFPRKDINLN